jgi:hypothetical protein
MKSKVTHPSTKKLKKDLWVIFSKYIRLRDCLKTTGTKDNGKCFTCNRLVKIHECDAGHFISRTYNSTLFNEKNVHLQCKKCNAFGGNVLEYRRQIVKMYGEGADIELEDKATELKKFSPPELKDLIEVYKEKLKKLEGK